MKLVKVSLYHPAETDSTKVAFTWRELDGGSAKMTETGQVIVAEKSGARHVFSGYVVHGFLTPKEDSTPLGDDDDD